MSYWSLIWCNLKRKKLRTLFTLLSILVAFLLYGLLYTIKEAFTAGVTMAGADRLIVRHKISIIMNLPEFYGRRISEMPGVETVAPMTWFGGYYQDSANSFFATFSVEPESFLEMFPEFLLPPEQREAWERTRTGAIVGSSLAARFGWEIGDRIPLMSAIWRHKHDIAWEFDIVGIYTGAEVGTDTSSFYFRYDYLDEGRAYWRGRVGWYQVRVEDPNRTDEIGQLIDAAFANSSDETKAEPEGAFAQGFVQQVGDIGSILVAILSAVFFTMLLIAGNTMAQAVRERIEEIGVLKSMGFTNELVLVLVLAESCAIAGIGGLLGLGIAWLIALGGSPVPSMLPVFYLPVSRLIIGGGLVFVLGIAAGILPALQAMRLPVAAALRRQA